MIFLKKIIAAVIFLIISPFLAAAFISIFLTSKGSPIFRQKRSGKNRKPFTIYKFRTMVLGAENIKKNYTHLNEADGPVFKIKDDPRYTGIGRFLSHTGLDEAPQLINIIKGDMDFVGPRPLPLKEAARVPKKFESRFSVLPGITSTWIIEGAHELSFKKWMKLDMDYVNKKSLSLDLAILFKTLILIMKFIKRKLISASAKKIFIALMILFGLGMMGQVRAAELNNIYGIHLAQPSVEDIKAAADLVNSNGGKWGYITLVIQENDRSREKWQGVFDHLRELHLIPIVRLATQAEGENWRRPDPEDAQEWADFLNSLNWVVEKRYVILFNEPNHNSEWGGEVDEKSFARVSVEFAKKLKEKNKNFFVMLAGFDASAPSWPPGMEDEEIFIRRAYGERKDLFSNIDGLSSHSYPNPAFAGSPYATGRGTVLTYQWELDLFRELGVTRELPVFITETGWKLGSENTVAQNFRAAYDIWSRDERVRAVTPFILNYQSPPFLEFSWKRPGDSGYWQQYYSTQEVPKIKGEPVQVERGDITYRLPHELVAQSKYEFRVNVKNKGQAIWDKDEGYGLNITNDGLKSTETLISDIKDVKPYQEKTIDFSLKTGLKEGSQKVKFVLTKDNKTILESKTWEFNILPLPSLKFEVGLFPFRKGSGNDFELQIFDSEERLVFKKKGIEVKSSRGEVKSIQNIALDELYRVVILKPGYLPRQSFYVFKEKENKIVYKAMLPIDFNNDGKFDWNDILKLLGR